MNIDSGAGIAQWKSTGLVIERSRVRDLQERRESFPFQSELFELFSHIVALYKIKSDQEHEGVMIIAIYVLFLTSLAITK